MSKSQIINSILRGADILKVLSEGLNRVSDISYKTNLNKSTIHRLLKSLEMSGLAYQDPIRRHYYIGPLIHYLASEPIVSHQKLIVCAFDDLRRLRDITRETVIIQIRLGIQKMCLEELQSPESVKYTVGKGFVTPIHIGSAGKLLLSELPDHELRLLLRNIHLVPVGPNTITDKDKFLKEIDKVRKRRYAISFGESRPGTASMSVPIGNYICPVALSLLGPDNRLTSKTMNGFLKVLRETSKRISRKLKISNGAA